MNDTAEIWNPDQGRITMTASALAHVQKQLKKQGHGIGLRLGIKKSGCSGYAYELTLIDETAVDDQLFEAGDNVIIVVAHQHLPVLQGTVIDYIKEGLNYRFHFNNPNEKASCGCGESFSV